MSIEVANELKTTFGERVRHRRLQLGWTQQELARQLGMYQPDLSDIENGKHSPTLETVERIADILGVSAEKLLA